MRGVLQHYRARVSCKRRCHRGPGRRHHRRRRTAASDRGACCAGGRVVPLGAGAADRDVRGVWHVRSAPAARGGHGDGADLRRGGVPPGSITAEARSRDTIGNIWFTKPLPGGPGGQRVIVATSDWHAARVRYLTQVMWGPGYRMVVEPVTGEAPRGRRRRPHAGRGCWRWRGAGSSASALVMTPRSLWSWPGTTRPTPIIGRSCWTSSRPRSSAIRVTAGETSPQPSEGHQRSTHQVTRPTSGM